MAMQVAIEGWLLAECREGLGSAPGEGWPATQRLRIFLISRCVCLILAITRVHLLSINMYSESVLHTVVSTCVWDTPLLFTVLVFVYALQLSSYQVTLFSIQSRHVSVCVDYVGPMSK